MEAALFGINLFLAYLLWSLIWRRTALDHYRDQLFDLRDEVRGHFLQHGIPLDHPLYRNLRRLLNSHLRYTEHLTFRSFVATTIAMDRNPETAKRLRTEVESQFHVSDPQLREYALGVRKRAISILLGYMGETSLLLMVLSLLVWPVVVVVRAVRQAKQRWARLESWDGRFPVALRFAVVAGMAVAIPARAGLIDATFDSDIVEEYSYQASLEAAGRPSPAH